MKAKWLAQANLCGCALVAVTLLPTDQIDPAATLEADDETEAVAVGDDWRTVTREAAVTMMGRTGRQMCLLGSMEHSRLQALGQKEAGAFIELIGELGIGLGEGKHALIAGIPVTLQAK